MKKQRLKSLSPEEVVFQDNTFHSYFPYASKPSLGFLRGSPLLDSLTLDEQERFVKFGEGPSVEPTYEHLLSAFHAVCKANPNAIAVRHEEHKVTYFELNQSANALATKLKSLGITNGDKVALFTERSIPMIISILAVLKLGAIYIPQDVRIAPKKQLDHIIKISGAKIILTLSRFIDRVPSTIPSLAVESFLKEINSKISKNIESDHKLKSDDPCFILFTSGTTGMPNGVIVTHKNLVNLLLTKPGNLDVTSGTKVSQILNIAFDMAAWEIFTSLCHGGELLIRSKSIVETVKQAEVVIATPSILAQIPIEECTLAKVVAVAGEPCPKTLADRWAKKCIFYNCCGPTEVTIVNTMQKYIPDSNLITIGKPTPNNTVYILDEERNPCSIGDVGEMWAGGLCVSNGYLENPKLTNDRYVDDPFLGPDFKMFRTRDLGRWTSNGELEHFGRTDDQVKIRGFRVELDSISAALESIENCKRAVTLKLDSQTLVSFVSPLEVDLDQAKKAVRTALPYYCEPSHIFSIDQLPMTDRGKIDKRKLTILALQKIESSEEL
ncbi:MAG: amino acid adenylation domain-containing protein [Oligoflexia bacterium]|nr:amino acid adenylation domain-containing protein [Oligoflexia bacterium]